MKQISTNILGLIQEIDQFWEPVYPYLAHHIQEIYGRKDGVILEIGPFCGAIYALLAQGVGSRFTIGAFSPEFTLFFNDYIRKNDCTGRVSVIETDQSLTGIQENSIDLVIFRGALFFPSLFRVDYGAISRVIKNGGIAMIGGGFGKFTPPEIIRPIAERSKELNLKIGKIEVTAGQVKEDIETSGVLADYRIVHEGGLWVILNKG
ncbi:MAG: methyltransferase [Deltaproteobacteria bacterium]|nr:methyltransferase [Deltaproteobacteria bacterium]